MPIGVEIAHGFGDALFNVPLIQALHKKHGETWVAIRPHCKDALYNIPFISRIIEIQQMNHGHKALTDMGCNPVFQITPNVKFFEFKNQDPNHSLIDTPTLTGRQLGVEFDPRPQFYPTEQELTTPNELPNDRPIIAIESVYKSAQSWATQQDFTKIINKFPNHRILWLSNSGCPNFPNMDNMLRYTRRQCIMCLSRCEYFFSVGSGFFCAHLALPKQHQAKKIICLWTDGLYRYEDKVQQGWHEDITWVHNSNELDTTLGKINAD